MSGAPHVASLAEIISASALPALLLCSAIAQLVLMLNLVRTKEIFAIVSVLPIVFLPFMVMAEMALHPELELEFLPQLWRGVLVYWPFFLGVAITLTVSFWGSFRVILGRWLWLIIGAVVAVDFVELLITIVIVLSFIG